MGVSLYLDVLPQADSEDHVRSLRKLEMLHSKHCETFLLAHRDYFLL